MKLVVSKLVLPFRYRAFAQNVDLRSYALLAAMPALGYYF